MPYVPSRFLHVRLNKPRVKIIVDLSADRIIVPMSRPSRGVVARRREGGAGCGTRERGEREPRPRAALGKPPRGTKTAGSVRLAVNAKAVMPRGASRGRGRTRHVRQGPPFRARP